MTLADLFLKELARDQHASHAVKELGKMLADKYSENLELCAALAGQNHLLVTKIEDRVTGLEMREPPPSVCSLIPNTIHGVIK